MPISTGQQIDAAEVNTRMDESRAAMNTIAATRRQWEIPLFVPTGRIGGAEHLRSLVFTLRDDARLVAMHLTSVGVGSSLITGRLEVVGDEDENRALLEKTISHSFTTSGTSWQASAKSFNTNTGDVVHLLKGVRYRFELSAGSGAPDVEGVLVLESGWRRG